MKLCVALPVRECAGVCEGKQRQDALKEQAFIPCKEAVSDDIAFMKRWVHQA